MAINAWILALVCAPTSIALPLLLITAPCWCSRVRKGKDRVDEDKRTHSLYEELNRVDNQQRASSRHSIKLEEAP
jgi:hypothetical protein